MSSRRSYRRYGVRNAEGCLKVVRDVAVWREFDDVFIAVSDNPEGSGELLMLERVINGTLITIEVAVIDSHPVIVNGRVQHRLRLRSSEGDAESRWVRGAR
jgi:hypothetical protein